MKKSNPPQANELELSLFGPGYDFGLGNIFQVGSESVKRNEWFIELGSRFGF